MFKLLIIEVLILLSFDILSYCLIINDDQQLTVRGSTQLNRTIRQTNTCGKKEPCDSGGECIDTDKLCDGVADCKDGSDETEEKCLDFGCSEDTYECAYGACVIGSARCNGHQDCADNSDENGCSKTISINKCSGDDFTCDNGQCIDDFKKCDGKVDCEDRSDETYRICHPVDCGELTKCNYGACVGLRARCNGIYDCIDGSDEKDCPRQNWLQTQEKCILPETPDNGYYLIDNKAHVQPGLEVPTQTKLSFYCNIGYKLSGDNEVICLKRNQWYRTFPTCLKTCPSKFDYSLQLTCTLNGRNVNCSEPAVHNTTIQASCKEHYYYTKIKNRDLKEYSEARCTDGVWNPAINFINCIPECGYKNVKTNVQPLIIGGQNVTDNRKYPWHVALFRRWEIRGRIKWSAECGGSIIRSNIVLTAAHCFVNSKKPENYAVGAGKITKRWNATEEAEAQYRFIKRIEIPRTYEGEARYYAHDIALIILTEHFDFNRFILPICLDSGFEVTLRNNTIGSVSGWGLTATGEQSDILKDVDLPYISYDHCKDNLKNKLMPYLTDDKICAGRQDGQAVCKGDSGGAYAIKNLKDDLYYVIGLVSVARLKENNEDLALCDTQVYTLFTNVSYHRQFINHIMRMYLKN